MLTQEQRAELRRLVEAERAAFAATDIHDDEQYSAYHEKLKDVDRWIQEHGGPQVVLLALLDDAERGAVAAQWSPEDALTGTRLPEETPYNSWTDPDHPDAQKMRAFARHREREIAAEATVTERNDG